MGKDNWEPAMSEYQDFTISLPFSVPPGDVEGVMTEALLDAALEHAPSGARGMTARGDTVQGKVWIVFTLVDSTPELAESVAAEMLPRVRDAVFSGDDACVTGA
jgi:hypothetical protein